MAPASADRQVRSGALERPLLIDRHSIGWCCFSVKLLDLNSRCPRLRGGPRVAAQIVSMASRCPRTGPPLKSGYETHCGGDELARGSSSGAVAGNVE
jgi:hypothetical protein